MLDKCPFCGSENVTTYKRGFSWLLRIFYCSTYWFANRLCR